MFTISLLALLTTTLAFVSRIPIARKSPLFRSRLIFSTIETQEEIVRTETQELFWITDEGLSIEVLAKDAKITVETKPVNERVYGSVVRFLKRITNNPEAPKRTQHKAPILFVHGSFHAAWCFDENYLDFFSSRGHQCFAISLRGTSTTGMPPTDPGESVRIEQHVSDIRSALASMKSSMMDRTEGTDVPDPVIVAHSFGGLIVMKLLEDEKIRKNLSGACFMCSVPPSGNGPMTQRFIKNKFLDSLKIVWGFVFKAATNDLPICRELFFDKTVPSEDIEKYMMRFRADSRVTLDLQSLDAVLPSMISMDHEGRADWLPPISLIVEPVLEAVLGSVVDGSLYMGQDDAIVSLDMDSSTISEIKKAIIPLIPTPPPTPRICPSMLVIGAEKDFIVDTEGVIETARFLGVKPVFLPEAYHDVMLGPRWRQSADVIAAWLLTI